MATLKSTITGNWLTSSTWNTQDTTSASSSTAATRALSTSAYELSSTWTWGGSVTVTEIGFYPSVITTPSGTMSIALDTGGSTVAGTEITINASDLMQDAVTASLNGGIVFFKLPSPVSCVAGTYALKMRRSSGATGTLSAFVSVAGTNWSRSVINSTTATPTTADVLLIGGSHTGVGTGNDVVVTMDETSTSTDYGAITVNQRGELRFGTGAATQYYLKTSGIMTLNSGGKLTMGASGSECPRGSSMTMLFDSAANVDFGLVGRRGSTIRLFGLSRTAGNNTWRCKLSADEAANQTTLSVDTDTGWLDNDLICIATSNRTATQSEAGALNGNAGATTITVDGFGGTAGGIQYAQKGTANTVQAEIGLITRNVQIIGASDTLQGYVEIQDGCDFQASWARFDRLGSNVAGKYGVQCIAVITPVTFDNCVFSNFVVTGSRGMYCSGTGAVNLAIRNCLFYRNTATAIQIDANSGTTTTIDGNLIILVLTTGIGLTSTDAGSIVTNNVIVGGANGISITEFGVIGTLSGNACRAQNSNGFVISNVIGGTILNCNSVRTNTFGITLTGSARDITIDGLSVWGCGTRNIALGACNNILFSNCSSDSDTGFTTADGVGTATNATMANIRFVNSAFSAGASPRVAHTNDIAGVVNNFYEISFENVTFGATAEFGSQNLMSSGSVVASMKHDKTAGVHKAWKPTGTITIDDTIFSTAAPSVRVTPLSASLKCTSCGRRPCFDSAVASGSTLTVSVKVRESVVGDGTDYNGNRIRLIVLKNVAAGIASDTVLATATVASEGAWETISGTTAAVTDNAHLQFTVDCDGTTGWINVDDWSVTTTADSRGSKFWSEGSAVAYNNNLTPDFPLAINVLNTDTVDGVPGRWQIADLAKYKQGEQYGVDGTSLTGTYAAGVEAGTPALTAVSVGDGSITVTATAAIETDRIYMRVRRNSPAYQWTDRSITFSRIGSGSITTTGLQNGIEYEVACQAIGESGYSDFGGSRFATPDADIYATRRASEKLRIRDNTAKSYLYVCQTKGVKITFTNSGEADKVLYAMVDDGQTLTVGVRTGAIEASSIVISVPRQTNFPPTAFYPNCRVTLNGKVYQVDTIQHTLEDINNTPVFVLNCSVLGCGTEY